jgi:hypothetical protein
MAKLFSFVLPLDIYSLGLITMITMVDERYNHRDYGEHVASKSDDENMKSAYSVALPSDSPIMPAAPGEQKLRKGCSLGKDISGCCPWNLWVIINQKGDIR